RSRALAVLAAGVRSSRRNSWALRATTTVEADIRIAPTLIGNTNPMGANTPAASGTAAILYPAAHHRFCFIFRRSEERRVGKGSGSRRARADLKEESDKGHIETTCIRR